MGYWSEPKVKQTNLKQQHKRWREGYGIKKYREVESTELDDWWDTVGREREKFWVKSAIEIWIVVHSFLREDLQERTSLVETDNDLIYILKYSFYVCFEILISS